MNWKTIDPKQELTEIIRQKGGWVNAHAHIDRSYIINRQNWVKTNSNFQIKWDLTDEFKSSSSTKQILEHMTLAVEKQLEQGTQALGSFIDCDSVVKDKSIEAARKLKERYGKDIKLVFMNQPIKGLKDETERKWFEYAAEFVDIIGGLPERDAHPDPALDRSAQHLDTIFDIAKLHNKPLHIHVDQLNSPDQKDTELAVNKTKEHNYAGRVTLIHCTSLAAQEKSYRQQIYADLVDQDISVITCPTAWIDSRRNETLAPTHNAITPVDEMIKAGVKIAIGTDNIADIYKPFSDGDMWTELKFLLEATHTYDMEALSKIATHNGLQVLNLVPAKTRLNI